MPEQPTITLNEVLSTLNAAQVSMVHALNYFEHRDQMNSDIHLQAVRYSPITDDVREACLAISQLLSALHNRALVFEEVGYEGER